VVISERGRYRKRGRKIFPSENREDRDSGGRDGDTTLSKTRAPASHVSAMGEGSGKEHRDGKNQGGQGLTPRFWKGKTGNSPSIARGARKEGEAREEGLVVQGRKGSPLARLKLSKHVGRWGCQRGPQRGQKKGVKTLFVAR